MLLKGILWPTAVTDCWNANTALVSCLAQYAHSQCDFWIPARIPLQCASHLCGNCFWLVTSSSMSVHECVCRQTENGIERGQSAAASTRQECVHMLAAVFQSPSSSKVEAPRLKSRANACVDTHSWLERHRRTPSLLCSC